jgi:hypothetical protein
MRKSLSFLVLACLVSSALFLSGCADSLNANVFDAVVELNDQRYLVEYQANDDVYFSFEYPSVKGAPKLIEEDDEIPYFVKYKNGFLTDFEIWIFNGEELEYFRDEAEGKDLERIGSADYVKEDYWVFFIDRNEDDEVMELIKETFSLDILSM